MQNETGYYVELILVYLTIISCMMGDINKMVLQNKISVQLGYVLNFEIHFNFFSTSYIFKHYIFVNYLQIKKCSILQKLNNPPYCNKAYTSKAYTLQINIHYKALVIHKNKTNKQTSIKTHILTPQQTNKQTKTYLA